MSYLRGPAVPRSDSHADRSARKADEPSPLRAKAAAGPPTTAVAEAAHGRRPRPGCAPRAAARGQAAVRARRRLRATPTSPSLLGAARVSYADAKLGINEARDIVAAAPIGDGAVAVDWSSAEVLDVAPVRALQRALTGRQLRGLPQGRRDREELRRLAEVLYLLGRPPPRRLELWRHAALQLTSKAGRVGARLPHSRPDRAARGARCRRREPCARSSRRSGPRWKRSCARRNRASRASSSRSRAGRPDSRLDWRDRHRRALRTQGDQRRHDRPCDDGGTRDSAAAPRNARTSSSRSRTSTPRRRRSTTWTRRSPTRRRTSPRATTPTPTTIEKIAVAPKRGQVTVQFVTLGWKAK